MTVSPEPDHLEVDRGAFGGVSEGPMIHHIVSAIGEEAAGPSYSVPSLCAALGGLGDQVVLHTLAPATKNIPGKYDLRTYSRSSFLFRLGISGPMKSALQSAARDADIFHSHGLWMLPNIYPARSLRGSRCPLVLSPRGMLDPWAFHHHRLRKKIMWFAGQRKTLESAACFHVTVEQEGAYVRALGCRAPIAVIPNGVDIPDLERIRYAQAPRRRLLFLARIHPKKGVDILLNAWRNVQQRFPDWELQIVGPDNDGYLLKMQALAAALGAKRVSFTGKILEIDKPSYYRAAHLYILPTHTENWGVSVAEALAHGLPAIVGKGAPWAGLETHQCGWWIENSIDAVTGTLEVALALSPEQLHERGALGRAWVQRDYCWKKVGQMMKQCYEWVLHGGGTRPPWIYV